MGISQPRELQALLLDYLEVHDDFTGFGFGDEQHGYVIAVTANRHHPDTRYYAEYADDITGGDFISYRLDGEGRLFDARLQVADLDIRERPWYRTARQLDRPVWSAVYVSISRASHGSLAITAAYPLREADGRLRGILTAILNLDRISGVLSGMELGQGGRIYVLEPDGLLVGSSDGANPIRRSDGEIERLSAVDSPDPTIRASARVIAAQPGGFGEHTMAPSTLELGGERFRLLMRPLDLVTGIHWHTVVVIPEATFLGGVRELLRWNLLVYLVVLALAALLGLYLAHRLGQPMLRLAEAARAMAAGNRSQRLPGSAIAELDTMARAFNEMAQQVQELVETLEWRVAERTRDLREARDAADAANRSKSVFLANMSHELRTPLTAILGYAQLLWRQGALNEAQRQSARVINRSGKHLLGLIDGVLDMSRIEAGRLECVPGTVDPHRLLEDLRGMLAARASTRGLALSIEFPTAYWLSRHPGELGKLALCSINLSGRSLGDEALLNTLERLLRATPLVDPGKLCFEVTEAAAIANLARAMHFIGRLQSLGCRFALDDFGSGLSSFAYLRELPVNYLKIDGVFVREILANPTDLALVRAMNDLAHVLGKRTVAEYVDNAEVLARLREVGVDYAQGYLFGRPRALEG